MRFTSKLRGHEIYTENGQNWYYSDNDDPTVGNVRACWWCKSPDRPDGHDACIGELPGGVMNACCGHGTFSGAYVQFSDGTIVQGQNAVVLQEILKTAIKTCIIERE